MKREYEAQEKLEKRLEQKQAKKDYQRLMKKYRIREQLDQFEDLRDFYAADKPEEEEGEEAPHNFQNDKEAKFYEDSDLDFIRHHKRTTRNFHECL